MESLLRTTLLLVFLGTSKAAKVLVVGDSMGEFSTNSIETWCSGAQVSNAAIGGTTAADWATFTSDQIDGCGSNFDYVWISVGGNDLLGSDGCAATASDIQSVVSSAIQNIKTNIAPGAKKYLTTCYCQPHIPEEGSACNTPEKVAPLCEGIKLASDADADVTYVPSLSACGGSVTSFSNAGYFEDAIHLNKRGFCKFFTRSEIQTLFECNAQPTIDCEG